MSENILVLNDENFEAEVLKSDIPVIVDFWASWCGPCRSFAPTFEKVAAQYSNKVKFAKMNVDEVTETTQRYAIKSIPTIIIFKNGDPVETKIGGGISEKQLKAIIDEHV